MGFLKSPFVMGVLGAVVGGAAVGGYLVTRPAPNPFAEGQTFMQKSKFAEAVTSFEAALKANPEHPTIRIALGSAYQALGKTEDALSQYQMADATAKNQFAQFYGNLAALYQQRKESEAAKDAFTKLAVFQTQPVDSEFNQALTLAAHGQQTEALREFDHILLMNPKHAAAAFQAGRVSEQMGNKKQAIRYYTIALKADAKLKAAQDRISALSARGPAATTKKTAEVKTKSTRTPASTRAPVSTHRRR